MSDEKLNPSPLSRAYRITVIALGATALAATLVAMDWTAIGANFLIFSIITVVFASRVIVRIPNVKGHISISETFIFLSVILFGGPPAILLSTLDAVPGSYRISKNRLAFLFNIAVYTLSTFTMVWTLTTLFGELPDMLNNEFTPEGLLVLCLMGLIQYLVNSTLIAAGVALSDRQPFFQWWKEKFIWTAVTYFAAASAAGIIAKLVGAFGIYAFLATAPIVAVVYLTYETYLRNVEAAANQAENAQRHVEELSHHIAEQERISRALKESEEYFRTAFDHAAGMAVINPAGQWMQVNESLCTMLGYTEEELLSNGFQTITHPGDLGNDLSNLYQLLEGSVQNYQLEKRYSHKWGHTVWVLQSASLVRDVDGNAKHVIFQIQDITDKKRVEERMQHAAFHDSLTGLPNRSLFTERLSAAIERSKSDADFRFAVIFTDLDRFKIVNDSLGHDVGDELLVVFGSRLRNAVRESDTVSRLGGDEFAILIEGVKGQEDIVRIAEKIQESVRDPFQIEGHEFVTTVSMGISCSSHGYTRPEDVLRDADTAMYKAKANGKARYELFDKEMHDDALQTLTLENELRRAIDNGDIKPYYQAIVGLRTGRIIGFEALARWIHPQRGLISPADFIPLAEETGMISAIGVNILNQATHQLAKWKSEYELPDLSVSVNLSVLQFKRMDVIKSVRHALNESGLPPHSLKLEVTESVVLEDTGIAIETLKALKQLGVQISIDDFGTGYSSMSYLHKFPFDVLKIDRSFTMRMAVDREAFGIIKTICALAAELGKSVIAEGVERREHQKMLSDVGCQYGQGYLFSKPVDAETAAQLLSIPTPWRDYRFSKVSTADHSAQHEAGTYTM